MIHSWVYIWKKENTHSKGYMHPNVHSSTTYNSQDMEANQVSINRQVDKEDVVCICNGILLSHKKEWSPAIFGNVEGFRKYFL